MTSRENKTYKGSHEYRLDGSLTAVMMANGEWMIFKDGQETNTMTPNTTQLWITDKNGGKLRRRTLMDKTNTTNRRAGRIGYGAH